MPIYRSLPDAASLEQLKRQAKDLLAELRSGNAAALRRLREAHPKIAKLSQRDPKLSDAQLVLAREYGFVNWPELRQCLVLGTSSIKTELIKCLESEDPAPAQRLLDGHPALVSARFAPHNDTPLHLAAAKNRLKLARLLVDRGANLEARNSWRATPLVSALISEHARDTRMVDLLVQSGAKPFSLREAAGVGNVDLMKAFWDESGVLKAEAAADSPTEIEPGIWRSDESGTPSTADVIQGAFEWACRCGRLESAQFLLERGAEVSGPGFFGAQPVHWAAGMGQTEVVRFLVARGANLELRDPKFNSTAFGWAMEFNQGETMSAIRELGYRLDIWEAAGFGDLDRLEELTSGDPSLLNAIRWGTPLSCACVANQLETVRWLLSRGADPKIANREGKLPLDLARERNLGAIAELIRGI